MVAIAEHDAAEPHRRLLQTMINRETFAAHAFPLPGTLPVRSATRLILLVMASKPGSLACCTQVPPASEPAGEPTEDSRGTNADVKSSIRWRPSLLLSFPGWLLRPGGTALSGPGLRRRREGFTLDELAWHDDALRRVSRWVDQQVPGPVSHLQMRESYRRERRSDLVGDVGQIIEADDADIGWALEPEGVEGEQRADSHAVVATHEGGRRSVLAHLQRQVVAGPDHVVPADLDEVGGVDARLTDRIVQPAPPFASCPVICHAADEGDIAVPEIEDGFRGSIATGVLVGQDRRVGGACGLRPAVDEYRPRAVQQLAGVMGRG